MERNATAGGSAVHVAAAPSSTGLAAVAGITDDHIPGISAGTIWELVTSRAASTPGDVLAYDERGRRLTFAELPLAAERVAAGLAARGVRPGSVVSWQLPSRLETVIVFTALSRLGAVQNPLIMMLRDKELGFICRQAKSDLLIVPSEFRGVPHREMAHRVAQGLPDMDVLVLDGELPEAEPGNLPPISEAPEVRWLFYTSGTTSDPKGAKHTDAGLLAASNTYCNAVRPEPGDRIAGLAPMAHVGGVLHVLSSIQVGCSLVLADIFEPVATSQMLSRLDVTFGGSGVPFARMLLEQQRAVPERRLFPRMKSFMMGGSPRPESLHYEVKEVLGGVGTVSGYGLTECPYISWGRLTDSDDHLALSDGTPGPGTQVRIVRADESIASPGEPGELRVRAPQLMKGYVDSSLDGDVFDEEGFFRTGDLATLDGDGYVTITGRLKEVIIRNMENISAREVEEHLLRCDEVADAAVIGLDDPLTGERVCAVVVPRDPGNPPTLESLTPQLLEQGLNKRKLPVSVEILDALPRNAMGKILKNSLRDRFNGQ